MRDGDAPLRQDQFPPTRSRKIPIPYDKALYRQSHRIEDWRRVAMRYDRCAHTFLSTISLAPTVLFWINESCA